MPDAPLPTLRLLLSRVHLQLIVFAVVLATASLMLSGVMVIRNYVAANLRLAADTVAYSAEPAVVFQDRQAMGEALAAIGSYSSVDRVELRDPAGLLLSRWERPHGAARGWLVNRLNQMVWPQPTRAVIRHANVPIGAVLVYGNSGGILRFIAAAVLIAAACIGLSVLGTRILARHLQQGVIGPLERVARVAHDVRRQRAFNKRVPAAGIAEIDRFGQDFNALLAELQDWHDGMISENAELKARARHDQLTGLGNRALFEQEAEQAIATGRPLALILIDIAGFKALNADHGIASGDAVLIAVAKRLRMLLRGNDAAFRIGGDEFAVLLLPVPERFGIDAVIDWIRAAISDAVRLPDGTDVRVTLAIGQARYPDEGSTIGELLATAESAMAATSR